MELPVPVESCHLVPTVLPLSEWAILPPLKPTESTRTAEDHRVATEAWAVTARAATEAWADTARVATEAMARKLRMVVDMEALVATAIADMAHRVAMVAAEAAMAVAMAIPVVMAVDTAIRLAMAAEIRAAMAGVREAMAMEDMALARAAMVVAMGMMAATVAPREDTGTKAMATMAKERDTEVVDTRTVMDLKRASGEAIRPALEIFRAITTRTLPMMNMKRMTTKGAKMMEPTRMPMKEMSTMEAMRTRKRTEMITGLMQSMVTTLACLTRIRPTEVATKR